MEEARFGMEYFLAFTTADGLDSDGERIYGKGSLQEVETGAVVPVGILHAEKEQIHTPTLFQVNTKQTRIPMDPPVHRAHQINNSSTLSAWGKY